MPNTKPNVHEVAMAVRRCPACRNYVDVETGECPVCGHSYARALIGKIARWVIILSLLAALAYHFVRRHSSDAGEKKAVPFVVGASLFSRPARGPCPTAPDMPMPSNSAI